MSLDIYLGTPHTCPSCGHQFGIETEGYWQNITHNMGAMAEEAGIYNLLWHPEKNGILWARQLVRPLESAISQMKAHPDHFRKFDPPNGWGSYDVFVPWLEKLLEACKKNGDQKVMASR